MHHYSVFGGCLAAEFPIPDLVPRRAGRADWRCVVADGPPPELPLDPVGEHDVDGWPYLLSRGPDRLRLVFAGCYVFDILDAGRRIVWYPSSEATDENVRALLLGPVLALVHDTGGALSLHGSAVAIGGEGIAFLAPKHHGKSTLALALTLAGGRHLSDDVVVVDPDPVLRVRPGVHSVRLWHDAAEVLATEAAGGVIVDGTKKTLTEMSARRLQRSAVPLGAVYVLRPVLPAEDDAGRTVPAVEREELPPIMATITLTGHTKLAPTLVGRDGSALQFLRAAEIARRAPVYALRVVRGFDRLDEVVRTILGWHAGARRRATPARAG
jgi:hypothetical protein